MPSGVKEIIASDGNDLKTLLRTFVATGCPTQVIRHKGSWSRSRTLSTAGREAILRQFKRQRPAQRQAIIDAILRDLTPEQIQAVYTHVKEQQEVYREKIDEKRELWTQELTWGPRTPWASDGITWSPGPSEEWGGNDAEAVKAVEEKEMDENGKEGDGYFEAVDSSEEDSVSDPASEAPTFATDSEDEYDDGDEQKEECDDQSGQYQLHGLEQMMPSQTVVLPGLEPSISEVTEENDDFGIDSVANFGTIGIKTCSQWTLEVDNAAGLDGASASEWIPPQTCPDTDRSMEDGTQENETKTKDTNDLDPKTPDDEPDMQDDEARAEDDFRQSTTSPLEDSDMQQPTPPVSPTTSLIEDFAEMILPFVLDKDEPDFVRTLKQSIDVWAERGETYKWTPALERAKPRPGPSPLHEVENADS